MKNLQIDLKHLQKIIRKWKKLCELEGTLAFAQKPVLKALFVAKDRRRLDDFSLKLKDHNTRIQMTVQTLTFGASEETRAAMKAQRKRDAVENRKRAKETKKLVQAIDNLTKVIASPREPSAEVLPVIAKEPAKLLEQLEIELAKQDMSATEVKASVDPIKKKLEKSTLSATQLPATKPKQEQLRILVVDGSNIGLSIAMPNVSQAIVLN